jgi:lysophospholipase L1-like esterase
VNYSIRKLLASFPHLHLFLIGPAWRLNFEDLDSDTHPNSRETFLREYVDAMIETYDGTHPNAAGAIRRGEAIAAFMSSVFETK